MGEGGSEWMSMRELGEGHVMTRRASDGCSKSLRTLYFNEILPLKIIEKTVIIPYIRMLATQTCKILPGVVCIVMVPVRSVEIQRTTMWTLDSTT